MKVRMDKRLELIFTIAYLSDYDSMELFVREKYAFTERLEEHFRGYTQHPVVRNFPAVWKQYINWGTFPLFAFSLTEDYVLPADADISFSNDFFCPGASLSEFVTQMQDFVHVSDFDAYFRKMEAVYAPLMQKMENILAERPTQRILEDYLGVKYTQTKVILSGLMKCFMYIHETEDGKDVVNCLCSRHWLEFNPDSMACNLMCSVWHEWSHHVVNPLTFGVFGGYDNMTQAQVDWSCVLNESIIFAITIRLMLQEGIIKESDIPWMIKSGIDNNGARTETMLGLMSEYEQNRGKYPSIADFHHVFVAAYDPVPE